MKDWCIHSFCIFSYKCRSSVCIWKSDEIYSHLTRTQSHTRTSTLRNTHAHTHTRTHTHMFPLLLTAQHVMRTQHTHIYTHTGAQVCRTRHSKPKSLCQLYWQSHSSPPSSSTCPISLWRERRRRRKSRGWRGRGGRHASECAWDSREDGAEYQVRPISRWACHAFLFQSYGFDGNRPLCVCVSCVGMGWLRLVCSLKLQVSLAKELYKRDYILQRKPIILRSLLMVATPYPFV